MNYISSIHRKLSVKVKFIKELIKLKFDNKYNFVIYSRKLRNIHQNKRIIIIGTGPSIKYQDLTFLKDDIVIALNEFYLHPEIDVIKPKYFLYTGYNIHKDTVDFDVAVKWYKEFEKCILKNKGTALLPISDFDFLKENQLMQNDLLKKYFFNYTINIKKIERYDFEYDVLSFYGDNSAINAIGLSIYMGAKEIYLLGLDHDWILTYKNKKQNHFYKDEESLIYKDHSQNFKRVTLLDNLINYCRIFEQYTAIEKYSKMKKINIYNMTDGGMLDVFRLKNYSQFIKDKS
jgi:hypothetical protein